MASRSYTVRVFSKDNDGLIVTVPCIKNSYSVPVDRVTDAVRAKLNLKEESFGVFGLFAGPLGSPSKLLLSGNVMPEVLQLTYQRLCFDAATERKVVKSDSAAMNLIFWEVKFMLDNSKIWPPPTLMQVIKIEQILDDRREDQQMFSDEQKRRFVDQVQVLSLFYWSRYYLVKEAFLNSSMSSLLGLNKKVMIALEYDKLVLIDSVSPSLSLDLSWNLVKSIWLEKEEKSIFVAEVLALQEGTPVLRKIFLETSCSEYLFSVTLYILRLHDKRLVDGSKPPVTNWYGSFYKYHNPVFTREK